MKKAPALATTAGAVVLVLIGCRLLAPQRSSSVFDHRVHARAGIACTSCHAGDASAAEAGLPTWRVCLVCHGDGEREPYPFEVAIRAREPDARVGSPPDYGDLRFSHAVHREEDVECEACHGDVGSSPFLATPERASYEACHDCHARRKVALDCAVCHEERSRARPPPSHASTTWMVVHGRGATHDFGRGAHGSCETCHARSDCIGCHQVTAPRDHTHFFRLQGHGIAAGIERERCTVCHQENFCVRCHEETVPRSHRVAAWGGGFSRHCLHCHEPISESRCSVCHRATPSHLLLATPIPPFPHPPASSNCRLCHLRAPHADNGSDCTLCHR